MAAVSRAGCPLCGCGTPRFEEGRALPDSPCPKGSTLPDPLTRAVNWLLEHYGEPGIGVASMAQAAQVGIRRLQELCRTHLDLTPGQLLREVRLYQARQALLAAQPGRDTVRGIAAGVGYLSPSRFGAHYGACYGEAPSVTLRRAGRPTPPNAPPAPSPDPANGLPPGLLPPAWARPKQEHPER